MPVAIGNAWTYRIALGAHATVEGRPLEPRRMMIAAPKRLP